MKINNLLIVDDDASVINSLKRNLYHKGFNISSALSGKEALEKIEKNDIHVILSDLEMPEINGITLLKKIKEMNPEIIRLVLSAKSNSKIILDAINKGNVLRYITKPWNDTELVNILEQAFELFHLKQENKELLIHLNDYNKVLEKEVKQKTNELFKIQNIAEIGKYTSQIVHNLNNPLNGILGSIQLIEEYLCKESIDIEKIQYLIELAKNSSVDLEQIISSILIHVRDEKSSDIESFDINELLTNEINLFELNPIFKNEFQKRIELDEIMPQFSGNRIHIKQIFDNLIKNAIDAMSDSKKKVLTIHTSISTPYIVIKISDTGSGIPKEKLDLVYLPDFTTKAIGKGTGLGLASVKSMVESYDGIIEVKSELNVGTTFTIKLPYNS